LEKKINDIHKKKDHPKDSKLKNLAKCSNGKNKMGAKCASSNKSDNAIILAKSNKPDNLNKMSSKSSRIRLLAQEESSTSKVEEEIPVDADSNSSQERITSNADPLIQKDSDIKKLD